MDPTKVLKAKIVRSELKSPLDNEFTLYLKVDGIDNVVATTLVLKGQINFELMPGGSSEPNVEESQDSPQASTPPVDVETPQVDPPQEIIEEQAPEPTTSKSDELSWPGCPNNAGAHCELRRAGFGVECPTCNIQLGVASEGFAEAADFLNKKDRE